MIKLIIKLSIVCSFIFSSISYATPIMTDLTGDSYVTYEHENGVKYDIAWASEVNSERYYLDSGVNTLYRADTHVGWDFATDFELDLLQALALSGELSSMFTRLDGSYIHAFDYWNDLYSVPDNTDEFNISLSLASEWAWTAPLNEDIDDLSDIQKFTQAMEILQLTGTSYDTFYFRTPSARPVPEPSSLLIFAVALIALASRKKLFN